MATAVGPVRLLGVGGPRRVVGPDPGQLDGVEHVHRLVLDDLEGGDGPVELDPDLGVLDRQVVGLLHDAEQVAAEGDVGVVDDPPPVGRVVAVGADPLGGAAVELEPGDPTGVVPRRHGLGLWGLDEERADPLLGAGRHQDPVGGGAVEDHRLQAVQPPFARPCAWPGCGVRSTGSPWPSSSTAMVPRVAPDASDSQLVVEPEAAGREGGEHRGGQERARGTARGPSPRGRPPGRPGPARARRGPRARAGPVQPSSTSWFQTCVRGPDLVLQHRPHVGARALLGEEGPDRLPQGVLVVAERELHRLPQADTGVRYGQ